jgi:hypothetical protein
MWAERREAGKLSQKMSDASSPLLRYYDDNAVHLGVVPMDLEHP